jgi:hypothetical protein
MDYLVDLDPTHRVIRITLTTETVTLELGKDVHRFLSLIAYRGPYASIIDLSKVTSCTIPGDAVRDFALRAPTGPEGTHVAVAREPSVFGLARMCSS